MENNQIAIVHAASSIDEVIQITFRNHAEYAHKYGYKLLTFQYHPLESNSLCALLQALENPEIRRVFWIDSDAVFTNFELRLTEHLPGGKVVMPYDIFGPSADCLWLENTQEVRGILSSAAAVAEDIFERHNHSGISLLKERMGLRYLSFNSLYNQFFAYVEQRRMKSQLNEYYSDGRPNTDFGQWQPGDFILHLGGLPSTIKIPILKDVLKLSPEIL